MRFLALILAFLLFACTAQNNGTPNTPDQNGANGNYNNELNDLPYPPGGRPGGDNLSRPIGGSGSPLNLVIFTIDSKDYYITEAKHTNASPAAAFEAVIEDNRIVPKKGGELRFIPAKVLADSYPNLGNGWTFSELGSSAVFGIAPSGAEPNKVTLLYAEFPGFGISMKDDELVEYDLYPTKRDGVVMINAAGLEKFHPRRVVVEWAPSVKFVQVTSIAVTSAAAAGITAAAASITMNSANSQNAAYYATAEALQVADNFLVFQKNCGGWDKDIDMVNATAAQLASAVSSKNTYATLDNTATTLQLEFLGRVITAGASNPKYIEAFYKGLEYVLAAQYSPEKGNGWPQCFPLRGGYYDNITFNDNAMTRVMTFMDTIVDKARHMVFVTTERPELYQRCLEARDRGFEFIMNSQLVVNGEKTAWAAQYIPGRTYVPVTARSYEPASLVSAESVSVTRYLMGLKNWPAEVDAVIEASVNYFIKCALVGWVERRVSGWQYILGNDRYLEYTGNPTDRLWARFYEYEDNGPFGPAGVTPIYMGRESVKRKFYYEIPLGRRLGYSWVGTWPRALIDTEFDAWKQKQPDTSYPIAGGTLK